MDKHASEYDTSAHCTITGQARTPSASTGSRAHAGKMIRCECTRQVRRSVVDVERTASSAAERWWYRQCRARRAAVTTGGRPVSAVHG